MLLIQKYFLDRATALESLVQTLHAHISHLTRSLNAHSTLLSRLQSQSQPQSSKPGPANPNAAQGERYATELGDVKKEIAVWRDEVIGVREGLEGLEKEVDEVKGLVDRLLGTQSASSDDDEAERHQERGHRDLRSTAPAPQPEPQLQPQAPKTAIPKHLFDNLPPLPEIDSFALPGTPGTPRSSVSVRTAKTGKWKRPVTPRRTGKAFVGEEQVERLRKEMEEASAAEMERERKEKNPPRPKSRLEAVDPLLKKPERQAALDEEALFQRANTILKNVPKAHVQGTCPVCLRRKASHTTAGGKEAPFSAPPRMQQQAQFRYDADDADEEEETVYPRNKERKEREKYAEREELPPQAVVARALGELEKDFAVHKKIYIELSDQYRAMDPASNAQRRRTLAEHLKESIDTLEAKADHIKRLYDALHCKETSSVSPILDQFRFGDVRLRTASGGQGMGGRRGHAVI
ncbi:hypothetical protein BT69DRAFT_71728 [Atractiella rhizophila]|nr:hypothetical protein BT69DRAFT_71728 [Atractiella rhizophila]